MPDEEPELAGDLFAEVPGTAVFRIKDAIRQALLDKLGERRLTPAPVPGRSEIGRRAAGDVEFFPRQPLPPAAGQLADQRRDEGDMLGIEGAIEGVEADRPLKVEDIRR